MESFVRSNFDKKILFNDRIHPNALFFHEMVQQISRILKITGLSQQKHNKVFLMLTNKKLKCIGALNCSRKIWKLKISDLTIIFYSLKKNIVLYIECINVIY